MGLGTRDSRNSCFQIAMKRITGRVAQIAIEP